MCVLKKQLSLLTRHIWLELMPLNQVVSVKFHELYQCVFSSLLLGFGIQYAVRLCQPTICFYFYLEYESNVLTLQGYINITLRLDLRVRSIREFVHKLLMWKPSWFCATIRVCLADCNRYCNIIVIPMV